MISIQNLKKCFGDNEILSDVCCDINKGEVVSIIGPSGCGKSTLLRCLNMLEKPTSGSIIIDGQNIVDPKNDVNKIRQKMGMVFQSFNLYAHLMVIENIMLGPLKLLKMSKDDAYSEAIKYLELVGLSEKAYSYPDELSGGQKQRVAIARTLAMHPEIILFDEPTSALDPTMVSEVLAVIRKLASEGLTMLIVTHEMKFARDVSTRVFYMDEKGIYESGTPKEIFDQPQKPNTRAFIQKIRSFDYDIVSRKFDLYSFNGKLELFLQKQMMTEKQIASITLVCEELIYNIVPDVSSTFLLEYSDITNGVTISVKYKGEMSDPLKSADQLSIKIIRSSSQFVSYSYIADENIIEIKF